MKAREKKIERKRPPAWRRERIYTTESVKNGEVRYRIQPPAAEEEPQLAGGIIGESNSSLDSDGRIFRRLVDAANEKKYSKTEQGRDGSAWKNKNDGCPGRNGYGARQYFTSHS